MNSTEYFSQLAQEIFAAKDERTRLGKVRALCYTALKDINPVGCKTLVQTAEKYPSYAELIHQRMSDALKILVTQDSAYSYHKIVKMVAGETRSCRQNAIMTPEREALVLKAIEIIQEQAHVANEHALNAVLLIAECAPQKFDAVARRYFAAVGTPKAYGFMVRLENQDSALSDFISQGGPAAIALVEASPERQDVAYGQALKGLLHLQFNASAKKDAGVNIDLTPYNKAIQKMSANICRHMFEIVSTQERGWDVEKEMAALVLSPDHREIDWVEELRTLFVAVSNQTQDSVPLEAFKVGIEFVEARQAMDNRAARMKAIVRQMDRD